MFVSKTGGKMIPESRKLYGKSENQCEKNSTISN
jgi:hypothetical protein